MKYKIKEFLGRIPVAELTGRKAELAKLLDVSASQLNRLARGESDPSGRQLWLMAQFFECSVDELYAEDIATPEPA